MAGLGYENPLEGLDHIGKARIHQHTKTPREKRNEYYICSIAEEELVEVLSALASWCHDQQNALDIYNDFAPEVDEDELENVMARQYSVAVVSKFLTGVKTRVQGPSSNDTELTGLGL